jgi:DNA-binding transcriptional LysR family regulator
MDLRQLKYFIAVAEARHIGRAAERLHLSQPPLTRQIQELEQELGVQLFRRTPRGMDLTPAGEEMLIHAQNIHSLVAHATARTQRVSRGDVGRLDIGIYGSAIFGVVPRVISAFRAKHPAVELVLHHAQTPSQLPALRQGRVQLVFERLLPEEGDIEVELVAREQIVLALSASHPLAAWKRVDVASLRDETVLVGSSPSLALSALQLCRANGFEPRFAPPASDIVTATLLAATGAGVSFVPDSMTNVHFPGIAYRPLSTRTEASMDVHCFYLRGADSPLLSAMLETVRAFRASLRLDAPPAAPRGKPARGQRKKSTNLLLAGSPDTR